MTPSRHVRAFAIDARLRRLFPAAALLAAAFLGGAGPLHAQEAKPAPEARIVVVGEGVVSVAPDYAEVRGGVTSSGKTAKEATDTNSKLIAAITDALLNAGIEKRDIQTSQFSVQPVYVHQPNVEPKFVGFNASNQLAIVVRQVSKLGDILDRMLTAGATNVGNIQFLPSDSNAALDKAREAAIADARHKAELYARAAGVNLGPVVWITEDVGSGNVILSPLAKRAAAPAMAVPIAPGEDTIRIAVTVGFDLAR
jgi:uncharacterized protein